MDLGKKKTLIIVSIILCLGIIYFVYANFEKSVDASEEKIIKSEVEEFIKTDYRFDGGDNKFSNVGNEKLKKELTAINNEKKKYITKKIYNHKFRFDYKEITRKKDIYIVPVNVLESYTFTPKIEKNIEPSSSYLEYEIFLEKKDGKYKIMSAYMLPDAGSNEENINEKLGYK